jgi:branched-chain amino acid transport system permease protein
LLKTGPWRFTLLAIGLLALPLWVQQLGHGPVRLIDQALLYVLLALGMNIVVGYAGLLDLGYVAFYAIGAYVFALLASPHLVQQFPGLAAMLPAGLHAAWWWVIPLAAVVAAVFGVLLGAPTLRLRGDYLAIVTLAFGEIVRLFLNNGGQPINITNGAHGITQIDDMQVLGINLGQTLKIGAWALPRVTLRYYLSLALPELLRYVVGPLQAMTGGRLDAPILRQLLVALAMIGVMLWRPRGLWPRPQKSGT